MIDTNRIPFLNTYIDSLTFDEATQVVDELIRQRRDSYIVTPNSDIIVKMQKDAELKDACDHADLILTDGQMLVKLSKWLGNPIKERVCMTDFVWNVCNLAEEKGYRLFLFGGKPEILVKGRNVILQRYPQLNIAGCCSPTYGFEKDEQQVKHYTDIIRSANPDVLLVFLGCPKQEKFIAKYRKQLSVPISIPMGGCIDFIAGNVKRAPQWMQKAGLEWFFRFSQEPKRLFRRYFINDIYIFQLARRYKSHRIDKS